MGSLKIFHPNLHRQDGMGKFYSKKPAPNLLEVLQCESDPNRSPLGSPPTEKKRVRRFSNSLLASSKKPGSPTHSEADKENHPGGHHIHPILKRSAPPPPRCASAPAAHSVTRCSHNRKVDFNAHVKVQYIGDTDTSYEPLNQEHSDRQSFLARNAVRRLNDHTQHPMPIPIVSDSNHSASSSPPSSSSQAYYHPQQLQHPAYSSSSSSTTTTSSGNNNNPMHSKNVNISFAQNSHNVTTMKFVVFMGPQYDPGNIVVKANMSGTRLRVVANLKPAGHSAAATESADQYNERFQLPMQVDPYKVEARLDARGYLTVTAPLIEPAASASSMSV